MNHIFELLRNIIVAVMYYFIFSIQRMQVFNVMLKLIHQFVGDTAASHDVLTYLVPFQYSK